MFGFLIAMIKTTYDTNNLNKLKNKYVQRCGMNQYSYALYRLVPFVTKNETDLVVVSGFFNEPGVLHEVSHQHDSSSQLEQVLKNQEEALEN
jgi:hypothetical protein